MESGVFTALPFPSFPYASAGGIVSFLRSPVHMFCRPLSQPFTASWIPRVNHTGFLSPSLRLQVGVKIMHYSYTVKTENNNHTPIFEKVTSPGMKYRAITLQESIVMYKEHVSIF